MERRKANKYPLVEDNHASENGDSSVSVSDQPIDQDQDQEDEKKRRMRELAKERQRKFRERKRMKTNDSDILSSAVALNASEFASPGAKLPEDKAVSVLAALQNNPDKNISSQATTYLLDLAKECGFDFKK